MRVVVAATAVLLLTLSAGTGPALASDGGGFGQHVSQCAQTHGLNGDHNPGMHRGHSAGHAAEC